LGFLSFNQIKVISIVYYRNLFYPRDANRKDREFVLIFMDIFIKLLKKSKVI